MSDNYGIVIVGFSIKQNIYLDYKIHYERYGEFNEQTRQRKLLP